MTILNESGIPDVLSPLCGLNRLAEKLPGVLVVVVGTQTEAYLVHSVSDALPLRLPPARRNPRVFSLVLDDGVAGQGRIASRVIEAAAGFRGIEAILLVAGHSARVLGVDVGFEARVATRRLGLPVRDVTLEPNPSGVLSTDLEDRAAAALVDLCPSGSPDPEEQAPPAPKRGRFFDGFLGRAGDRAHEVRRPVVLLGAATKKDNGELCSELRRAGVGVVGGVPGPVSDLPDVAEDTVVAVADPYLAAAARCASDRAAQVVETLMPIGIDGTARFIQDVAAAAGPGASELSRARAAWELLEPLRNRIRGKRIFFAGDTGLEIPVARFLVDAGAVVLEVGAPRLDRRFLAAEIQILSAHVDVVESPDPRGQLERIEASRPDVVIASPGLYVPLVARGHLCRSSLDFLGASIHGYGGARRILELFVRAFERAEALDSVKL